MGLSTEHLTRDRLGESIASYDSQPAFYAERFAGLDTSQYIDWILPALKQRSEPRVLDLGCGTGRDLELLTERGVQVVGVDLSRSMVSCAGQRVSGARLIVGDALDLPIESGSIDGVWAMASLVHLDTEDTRRALSEIARVLRRDSPLFLSVPWGLRSEWRSDSSGGRRWFRYYESADEVSELLKDAGLNVLRIEDGKGLASGRWISALAKMSRDE